MTPSTTLYLIILAFISPALVVGLNPEGSNEKNTRTDVYKIVMAGSGRTEYLPASYVKTFPRWQISQGGHLIPVVAAEEQECDVRKENKTTKISIQPTINFLLKAGIPTYLFVGLWVHDDDDDDQSQAQTTSSTSTMSTETHHLAQEWITFDQAAQPNFHVEVLMGPGMDNGGNDQRRLGKVDAQHVQNAVEQLGIILATTTTTDDNQNTDNDIAHGFQIVSIALKMNQMEDLDMKRGKGGTMMLTCVATVQPDALQLLNKKGELDVENTATSILHVEAFKVLSTMV